MRFGLLGSGDVGDNAIVRELEHGIPFIADFYISMGYIHYQVWVIGAAGGRGGGIDSQGSGIRTYGGAGGGGGSQLMYGLLANLSEETPVVVGRAGADAADSTDTVNGGSLVQPGGNGGYSQFGNFPDGFALAAGGAGGKAARSINLTTRSGAEGGNGGWPGTRVAGTPITGFESSTWGRGGTSGTPNGSSSGGLANGMGQNGSGIAVGPYLGGVGGGGGAGGVGTYIGRWANPAATRGGNGGSSNPMYIGPAGDSTPDISVDPTAILIPGAGGGAQARSISNQTVIYGSYAPGCVADGAVVIKIYRE